MEGLKLSKQHKRCYRRCQIKNTIQHSGFYYRRLKVKTTTQLSVTEGLKLKIQHKQYYRRHKAKITTQTVLLKV